MRSILLPWIFLFTLSTAHADSNLLADSILSKPGFIGNDYYYKDNKLKTSDDFGRVFLQSQNRNVMKYFNKWKKMSGVEFLPGFGALGLGIYYILSTSSNSNEKVEFRDVWYIPVFSVALISIGIPSIIIKQKYKTKSIEEFNANKF
jgi:hypothetical protein